MKKLIAMVVILVLTLIPMSCFKQSPSVEDVESFVKKNWSNIVLVNGFLLGFENKDVSIYHDSFHAEGEMLVDLNHQQIEDGAVREAIQSLWKAGCTDIYKSIHGPDTRNVISYTIWTRTRGGVSCGFAYAIDQTQPPKLQYQTKLVPLSIEGWYYYVENYEEWRQNRKTQHNTSIK